MGAIRRGWSLAGGFAGDLTPTGIRKNARHIADATMVSSKCSHKRPGARDTTADLSPTVSLCILRFDLLVRRWTVQRLAVTSPQVSVAASPIRD